MSKVLVDTVVAGRVTAIRAGECVVLLASKCAVVLLPDDLDDAIAALTRMASELKSDKAEGEADTK